MYLFAFFAVFAVADLASGVLQNIVPDGVEVAHASVGGALKTVDGDTGVCFEKKGTWGQSGTKLAYLLKGAQVGVEYRVRKVKIYYKSSFADVEQSTVYVGHTQCGQIHQNLPVDRAEKSVVVRCNNGDGYLGSEVWIRSDRNMKVCEVEIYTDTADDVTIPTFENVAPSASVSQNDDADTADLATNGDDNPWGGCTKVACYPAQSCNHMNRWTADLKEEVSVRSVMIISPFVWNSSPHKQILGTKVLVTSADGVREPCGTVTMGRGGIATNVNLIQCGDKKAVKLEIFRESGQGSLGLCEVEINAVESELTPTSEPTALPTTSSSQSPTSSTTASTETASTETASTEAASTEATSTEAASTEATPTEAASTEAASTEATSTEAASTEAASTEAASTEAASTEAASTEAASTEATSTEAASSEAASTEAASTEAASTKKGSTTKAPTMNPATTASN